MPITPKENVTPAPRAKRAEGARGHLSMPEREMFTIWVFELHALRTSMPDIIAETGLAHKTVKTLVHEAYQRFEVDIKQEFDKDVALVEELMFDAVRRYRTDSSTRNLEAIEKLLTRRARMLGYDKEIQKVQLTTTVVEPEDIELLQMISEQKAKDALLKNELESS